MAPPTPGVVQFAAMLPNPTFFQKWNPRVVAGLAVYLSICLVLLLELPNTLWDPRGRHLTIVIGGLGL
jgi:hypothetical protein